MRIAAVALATVVVAGCAHQSPSGISKKDASYCSLVSSNYDEFVRDSHGGASFHDPNLRYAATYEVGKHGRWDDPGVSSIVTACRAAGWAG